MPNNKVVYESPPGSGGNDGAIPKVYRPGWQAFGNLSVAQQQWFATNRDFMLPFIRQRIWLARVTNPALSVTVTPIGGSPVSIPISSDEQSVPLLLGMRQALDDGLITTVPFSDANGDSWMLSAADANAIYVAVMTFVQQLFAVQHTLLTGFNAKTIANPAQVEAAIAAVAPNSLSATSPQNYGFTA